MVRTFSDDTLMIMLKEALAADAKDVAERIKRELANRIVEQMRGKDGLETLQKEGPRPEA